MKSTIAVTESKVEKTIDFTQLRSAVRSVDDKQTIGKVAYANGTLLKVTGLSVKVGELCRLKNPDGQWQLEAEVVGLAERFALLTPLGSLRGICRETQVFSTGVNPYVEISEALLGRVLNAAGSPLDGDTLSHDSVARPLYAEPPNPLHRRRINRRFETGVRAIDSMLTIGEGQRVGIFSVAGGGKSKLLGMLARGSGATVNVIALVGERGREVSEFVRDNLQDSQNKSVVVAATSDRPALERARAVYTATTIAEYFRDRGERVLLLVDSITRYARALRDVGLAVGEPPTRRGYPPSVFSQLPQLMERAGNNNKGSITAFYTVLVEDEYGADPIAEEARSILDGHICLSRKLAGTNHFPPIDILNSASRLMDKLVTEQHSADASRLRQLLAKYEDIEMLVQMGEYQPGNDSEADDAMTRSRQISRHLTQSEQRKVAFDESVASLAGSVRGSTQ